jgi:hypothetical protein
MHQANWPVRAGVLRGYFRDLSTGREWGGRFLVSARALRNMLALPRCALGIVLLALAVATSAAAQPPAVAPTGDGPIVWGVSDTLRRLPSPYDSVEATRADGSTTLSAADHGDGPGTFATMAWQTSSGSQAFEALETPPMPLPEGRLDAQGELIQIAPDPLDPWSNDLFGRYSYDGAGNPDSFHWIPGDGDQMGILTIPFGTPHEPKEGKNSFSVEATWHLLGGPRQTDMPPHLWDLAFRWGRRAQLDSFWSYDVAVRGGWFSDFEGSAREGLRFPAHGLIYYTPSDSFQMQVGFDYLDRDDIACLPVFGFVFKPTPNLRLDAVFPRPTIAIKEEGVGWLYLSGEMDGGTWAIQRADGTNDVATYRDYRLLLGLYRQDRSVTEVGLVFDRHLEYRSGTPSYAPMTTTMLRYGLIY